MTEFSSTSKRAGYNWQQTMLRIKDPKLTVPFYEKNFGFKLVHNYDFPQWNFGLYFMAIIPPSEEASLPPPGTKESEEWLWNTKYTVLELTHNYGSETDENFKVNTGNVEPHRGFGHLAVMTRDVYIACEELETNGCKFQKKPDEGRMKGLAFVLDPDGYWIEVVKRKEESNIENKFTFAQTMIRIKDPKKSLEFYRDKLGMTLLSESHLGVGEDWGFSLYFLANVPAEEEEESKKEGYISRSLFNPVLELTHNHGTETKPDFKYHNGNDTGEGQIQGFGHTGFLCNDLNLSCKELEEQGVTFKKKPQDGNMKCLAFAYDPDGYLVELIERGGVSFM